MTRSWSEILDHYRSLVDAGLPLQSMVTLVEMIHSSGYSERLFAWTSMQDLCIVQSPDEYPYDGPYLKISPLPNDKLEFRYLDTYVEEKQWHRVIPGADAFGRLERFIEQLHWF